MLSAKDFTKDKLAKMETSAGSHNLDRDNDAVADDYGRAAAKGSDSSHFRAGGAVKRPHMGRPGRANGGRAFSGSLIKTIRSEKQAQQDQDADVTPGREAANAYDAEKPKTKLRPADGRISESELTRSTERESRARGGRTGKSKTVVNIVVGGDRGQQQQQPQAIPVPHPVPVPSPPPMGAQPPGMGAGMPPGMGAAMAGAPPGGMPIGGAPMGAAGAPRPGMPPMMRARGGRIEGHYDFGKGGTHNFGKGGTKAQTTVKEKFGAGGGKGRLEKQARQE